MKRIIAALFAFFALLALPGAPALADLWDAQNGQGFDMRIAGDPVSRYRFEPRENAYTANEECFLLMDGQGANGSTLTVNRTEWGDLYGYWFEQGGERVFWQTDTLEKAGHPERKIGLHAPFVASALPQTAEQVRRMNRIISRMPNGMYIAIRLTGAGTGTLPVYAAPSEDAYRAAGGRASVGLAGDIWVLDWRDGYMMIAYDVDSGQTRVGYVRENASLRDALARQNVREDVFENGIPRWGSVEATVCEDTALIDDPVHEEAEALRALPAGETVTFLGSWGTLYAYVRAEIGGREARGFVPLRALDIPEPPEDEDAMARLCGTSWTFTAGGNMYADFQSFREGGALTGAYYNWDSSMPQEPGDSIAEDMIERWITARYSVAAYDPAWHLFWDDVPYMITYTNAEGRIARYGLEFNEEKLSLITEEGGGGFIRYTGAMDIVPLAEPAPLAVPAPRAAPATDEPDALSPEEMDAASAMPEDEGTDMAVRIDPAQQDGTWFSHMACALMRTEPDADAPLLGVFLPGAKGTALEEQGGFVRARIADMEGWLPRGNVLLGEELEGEYISGSLDCEVYVWGQQASQPVYDAPSDGARVIATLPGYTYMDRLAFLPGDEWTLVRLDDGRTGYMRSAAVCVGSNGRDAWIYSEDPTRRLNLRAGPDKQSESLGLYYSGVRVVFLESGERHEGWARVSIDGAVGWVSTEFLCYWNDYCGREWLPPIGTVQGVNADGLNLREAPDGGARVIAAYPAGTKVEILGVTGAWGHVRLRDGNVGYMQLRLLGGEPKRAAANGFSPREDVTQTIGETTFRADQRGTIEERPRAQWHVPEGELTPVWGEPERISVKVGEDFFRVEVGQLRLDW